MTAVFQNPQGKLWIRTWKASDLEAIRWLKLMVTFEEKLLTFMPPQIWCQQGLWRQKSHPGCSKHPEQSGYLTQSLIKGQTVEPLPLCLCFSVMKTVTLSKGQWHSPGGLWYRKYKQVNRDRKVPLLTLGMSLPMERSNNCHPKVCLFDMRSTLLLRDKRLRKNLDLFITA